MAGTLRAEGVLALANLIWVALLALGGVIVPRAEMPSGLSHVAALLPSGALGDGLREAFVHGRAAGIPLLCWSCGARRPRLWHRAPSAGATEPAWRPATPAATTRSSGARHDTNPWLRRVLLVNLILEIGIVVTGGLVRLTGSGLGCPTWPQCVPGSFTPVPHQEQGFHKIIEFGNRTLTSVVGVAALLVIVAVWRWAPGRRALLRISVLPLVGVMLQAVLGGITVLTGLNPAIVAAHFLASMVLVSLSAYLLYRVGEGDAAPVALARPEIRSLAWATAALGGVILVLGTVVTGSGPHSGDAATPRFGFDPRTVAWLHADAVMLFLGLVVAVLLAVRLTAADARPRQVWLRGPRRHVAAGAGRLHAVPHRPARGAGPGPHARRQPACRLPDLRRPEPAPPLTRALAGFAGWRSDRRTQTG